MDDAAETVAVMGQGEDAAYECLCRQFLENKYGKKSLKRFEFGTVQRNGRRALVTADVKIGQPPTVAPVTDGVELTATAVFALETDDRGNVRIVDYAFR